MDYKIFTSSIVMTNFNYENIFLKIIYFRNTSRSKRNLD
jgi:hypothetical protein